MVSMNVVKSSGAAGVIKAILLALFLVLCPVLCLTACQKPVGPEAGQETGSTTGSKAESSPRIAPELPGHALISTYIPEYAQEFTIYDYEGGFTVLEIDGKDRYLLAGHAGDIEEAFPELSSGGSPVNAPGRLQADIVPVGAPKDIYLCATASMALLDACGGLQNVTFSSLEQKGWYIDSAGEAMEEGRIIYAGKYSAPDYELLISENCDLAVESTMIFHHPEVKEMLEKTGIPVLVDYSGYESHPLGRAEWVVLYGTLTGHREEAERFFAGQKETLKSLENLENTGKRASYFYINASGMAVVRASDDYIAAMMRLAGGHYTPDNQDRSSRGSGSVTISMEEFYREAADADILIYNGSIDGALGSAEDLVRKDAVFADFAAVKSGNCWCTDQSFFQQTAVSGDIIAELHSIFTGEWKSGKYFIPLS